MHLIAVSDGHQSAFVIQKKRIEEAVNEVAIGILESTEELDAVPLGGLVVASYVFKDDGTPVPIKLNQAPLGFRVFRMTKAKEVDI
ncbi:MAG: hypothetical protein DME83_05330 [Verrucomicrobia bacterium]|nr:MAG: hypothetical protein DME83_05330 [Verrucomicrobiota bacterium]